MMMVKIFSGVLLISTLVYAGGEFQFVPKYESEDRVLAEKAYLDTYLDEPVILLDEAYVELSISEKEDDIYLEPKVEAYIEPLIEEESIFIMNSSNLSNAVNIYNTSKHGQNLNGIESVEKESTETTNNLKNTMTSLTGKRGFYAGLGITALNYNVKCDCPDKSAKDTALGGMTKVGYNFNKFIGIEARGMKVNLKNSMGSVKHAGVFFKPMLPLGPIANAYSLVGVAQTKTSGKIRKIDTKSLALGAGMEFGSGKGVGAFVDYEKLVLKSGAPSFDTLSTGVSFGF